MGTLDIETQQEIAATPTGMAPAADASIWVLHPGYQTPLDAADPFARANSGWVSNSDDPIANRDFRYTYGENVQEYLLAGVLP